MFLEVLLGAIHLGRGWKKTEVEKSRDINQMFADREPFMLVAVVQDSFVFDPGGSTVVFWPNFWFNCSIKQSPFWLLAHLTIKNSGGCAGDVIARTSIKRFSGGGTISKQQVGGQISAEKCSATVDLITNSNALGKVLQHSSISRARMVIEHEALAKEVPKANYPEALMIISNVGVFNTSYIISNLTLGVWLSEDGLLLVHVVYAEATYEEWGSRFSGFMQWDLGGDTTLQAILLPPCSRFGTQEDLQQYYIGFSNHHLEDKVIFQGGEYY